MPTYSLTIGGTDRTSWLARSSCRITTRLNGGASLSMRMEDNGRGYTPAVLDEIIIENDASPVVRIFGGYVKSVQTYEYGTTGIVYHQVSCEDYNSLANNRLVTGEFSSVTLAQIVNTIISYNLDDEVSNAGVETGPTITETLVFNYQTVKSVFDRLANITGYQWIIDHNKVLYFSQFAANPAPFSIADNDGRWRNMKVTADDKDYMNRVYVRTEYVVAGTYTESIDGDGLTRNFLTDYPMGTTTPTIIVNGATQTIAPVLGYTPGSAQWIWQENSRFFFQDNAEPILTGGDTATIEYEAQFDNVIVVEDLAEQALHGIRESISEQRNISDFTALQAIGNGLLRQHKTLPTKVEFETDTDGLEVGQQLGITVAAFNLSDTFLIEEVETSWLGYQALEFRYRIRATSAEPVRKASVLERLAEVARIGPSANAAVVEAPVAGIIRY